eukprot:1803372-Rhodomonas_salina.3
MTLGTEVEGAYQVDLLEFCQTTAALFHGEVGCRDRIDRYVGRGDHAVSASDLGRSLGGSVAAEGRCILILESCKPGTRRDVSGPDVSWDTILGWRR